MWCIALLEGYNLEGSACGRNFFLAAESLDARQASSLQLCEELWIP